MCYHVVKKLTCHETYGMDTVNLNATWINMVLMKAIALVDLYLFFYKDYFI